LLTVAHYLIGHLSYSQVPALAKRHKVEANKDSASAQELLAKQVGKYEEAELCKLLLEISLLDLAYQRSSASRGDVLMTPPNATEWMLKSSRKPWPRSLKRNEAKRQESSRRIATRRQHEPVHLCRLFRQFTLVQGHGIADGETGFSLQAHAGFHTRSVLRGHRRLVWRKLPRLLSPSAAGQIRQL